MQGSVTKRVLANMNLPQPSQQGLATLSPPTPSLRPASLMDWQLKF